MCILCKEWILKKMTRREVVTAGKELLRTSKGNAEYTHVLKRLEELKEEDPQVFKQLDLDSATRNSLGGDVWNDDDN